jgi:phosphoenolpyruvate carboxylase|tara:strand:- start:56 stop:502 length:447 start_codon:yes stop_codon:yes gene_type:complete
MELKNLLVDSKTTWVDFPGLDGFNVELALLSRKELMNLRKKCTDNKFNRKTRAFEETLNDEKFVKEFTNATVKNWKGLKMAYLEDLLLVDLSKVDPEDQMEYSEENACILVDNSQEFDNWLNEVVFDLENFRSEKPKKVVKASDPVSG